tara:strand:- start:179 stop:850 length:672 start_codon:yes stop_codon:yes gene_type:complete
MKKGTVVLFLLLLIAPSIYAIEGDYDDTVVFCPSTIQEKAHSCGYIPLGPEVSCTHTPIYGSPFTSDCVCPNDYSDGLNSPDCYPGKSGYDYDCTYDFEICNDGIDNDGIDGIDCFDPKCAGQLNGMGETCCRNAVADCLSYNFDFGCDISDYGPVCDSLCADSPSNKYDTNDCDTGLGVPELCWTDCVDKGFSPYCIKRGCYDECDTITRDEGSPGSGDPEC